MKQIKKMSKSPISVTDVRKEAKLKNGLMPIAIGIALMSAAPSVMADDECGPGPTVVCTDSAYTGITYNFSSNLDIVVAEPSSMNIGEDDMTLNGSGDADLTLAANNSITGLGGIRVNLVNGDVSADIHDDLSVGAGTVGLQVVTGGSATINLRGQRSAISQINTRLGNLVMDVGKDSTVTLGVRRTVQAMTLSPRAGATLTVYNKGGILGSNNVDQQSLTDIVYIRGAGAGNLVLDNTAARSRIGGGMDFTGMTGKLTVLMDNSGNTYQGGWHTAGTSSFGSGEVEFRNGSFGVVRTAAATVFDFSDAQASRFYNEGRLMVGAKDINTADFAQHLSIVGLDSFENAGLILMGTVFQVDYHQGLVTNARVGERLTFHDSNYIGMEGGRIALDVALAGVGQADCSTLVAADCVQFTGGSTTSGTTLLDVTDVNPLRSVARFNPGITLIEGASAAEHFVLDPASQFYVGNTSGGAALQKGLVAYRLQYDAGTQQHRLVGTLADEAAQASTLGAAAHEAWRVSADTWFDRQAAVRAEGRSGFTPQATWFTANTSKGDRSLSRTVDVAGAPTDYNLGQDQSITHVAFGMDLLQGSSARQFWSGGVTAGLLRSTIDYEATRTQTELTGLVAGIYGSWGMAAGLTVDGMFNANYLRQELDGSHFALGQYNRMRSQVKSNGGRVEAAWKLSLNEGFWLQPLLGVSSVRTSEGDISLPDGAGGIRFGNDDRSLRVGGGLRVGIDSRLAGLRSQYRLTARMWNEREADSTVLVDVGGEPQPVAVSDDFSGNFNEVDGSVSLSNDAGSLSGYVGVKTRFSEDYSSVGGSAGVRYHW